MYVLTGQKEQPALHREQLVLVVHDTAVSAEQLETLLQAVGQLHIPAVAPELPLALGLVVVDHEEIADALVLERKLPVVVIDVRLPEMPVRKELQQQRNPPLNQM